MATSDRVRRELKELYERLDQAEGLNRLLWRSLKGRPGDPAVAASPAIVEGLQGELHRLRERLETLDAAARGQRGQHRKEPRSGE